MRGLTKIAAITSLVFSAVPAWAGKAEPFPSHLEVLSEDGPVDLEIMNRYSPMWGTCVQGARTTQASDSCHIDEFARQNTDLNRTWRHAYNLITPALRPDPLKAQRKWLAQRDPFCRHEADRYAGGTIMPIVYSSCRVELTVRRTVWLERIGGGR